MGPPLTCRRILVFSAAVELATGGALMLDPAIVVNLLLGTEVTGIGIALGRCFGIALVALGLACWPSGQQPESTVAAVRAMLTYNALIALFLVYLFGIGHLGGVLLWPGVVLHGGVALLLILTLRGARQATAVER